MSGAEEEQTTVVIGGSDNGDACPNCGYIASRRTTMNRLTLKAAVWTALATLLQAVLIGIVLHFIAGLHLAATTMWLIFAVALLLHVVVSLVGPRT